MKKIGLLVAAALLLSAPLALAEVASTSLSTVKYDNVQPYYVEVLWGKVDQASENPLTIFDMSIDKGVITVAKDILILPEEILTNATGDVGVMSSNLHAETKPGKHFQGVVVKIFPDPTADKTTNMVHFSLNNKSVEFNMPVGRLGSFVGGEPASHPNEILLAVRTIQYKPELTVKEASVLFARKMEILKRMIGIERWMRGLYDAGKVSEATLIHSRSIFSDSMMKDYSEESFIGKTIRITRLFYSVNKRNLPPELFLAGVKRAVGAK